MDEFEPTEERQSPGDGTNGDGDQLVVIVDYDPTWPARFASERDLLISVLTPWIAGDVYHVGSTAVPGLAAKPIIDIMVGVEDLDRSRQSFGPLAEIDYRHYPYRATEMHWFCKPDPAARTHHLHLIPVSEPRYREELVFRDRLRASPALAADYADLKRLAAAEFGSDREAYTESKSAFIRSAIG